MTELECMIARLRDRRNQLSLKNNTNPVYHAYSQAISSLTKLQELET